MRLSHYTSKPFTLDTSYVYRQDNDHFKPRGLWLSVDGEYDWKQWCADNDFSDCSYRTEIIIAPDANILHLRTVEDIDKFTQAFSKGERYSYRNIRWAHVAQLYQGLVITPYQWERRNHVDTFWYYSWDCASGCVWDMSIVSVRTEVSA